MGMGKIERVEEKALSKTVVRGHSHKQPATLEPAKQQPAESRAVAEAESQEKR